MSLLGLLFFLVAATALLAVPRRWAAVPLLAGACYMTLAQDLQVGPFRFTLIRLLLLVGVIRVLTKGERPAGGLMGMDKLFLCWASWALIVPFFRGPTSEVLVNHLGMIYNYLGMYFLMRCFCQEWDDLVRLAKTIAVLLVPVALAMVYEQLRGRNLFSILGGVSETPAIRNGRLRSQGPFTHAILAGTVGAVTAPLMIGLWQHHRKFAAAGLAACLLMVLGSASSGPLMSLMLATIGIVLWRWRHLTRQMRITAVVSYLLLELVMNAPAYFVIARIDLVGGSTGWHRAELIRTAIEHLSEWWIAGTDYTRHWMPVGTSWSEDHVDITNHYLAQGVRGGLPLMAFFIAIMVCGFRYIGASLRQNENAPATDRFFIWCLGASLFAHATTSISVAYFDQSLFFLITAFALTASLQAAAPVGAELMDHDEAPSPKDNPLRHQAGRTQFAMFQG